MGLRILVNGFAARAGGGRWFTSALIQEMARQNPDWYFLVYFCEKEFGNDWPQLSNVDLSYEPSAVGLVGRNIWQHWRFRKISRSENIDIIFSPLCIGTFFPSVAQVTVQRNAHIFVNKVTKEIGGTWLKKRIKLLAAILSMKSSKENIFVSQYMIDLASRWTKPDGKHWHVIFNSVNTTRFEYDNGKPYDFDYILSVGTVAPHKNVLNLLKAFKIIKDRYNSNIKLVLTGQFYERTYEGIPWKEYIKDLLESHEIRQDVIFTGRTEGKKLASLYKYAEVCVVPSILESFGIVASEAICCGTACCVSDISVFHEIYRDSVLYFDSYSPQDISDKTIQLLSDKNLQDELVNRGKKFLSEFSISKTAQRYAEVLNNVTL
jgi:glycosyltransferase involved in cell wall biosynthesis